MGERRMLIDGKLVDSSKTFDNINPATEEVIGVTADAGVEEADRALDAARRAFDETSWSTDHALRRRCLEQLQAAMTENAEELRAATVAESGCPISLTYNAWQDYPVQWISFYAELAEKFQYETPLAETEVYGAKHRGLAIREPIGVVGAITPFNLPIFLNLAKVAAGLAAGCTIVLKPSPDTPWSATIMGRLIAEKTDMPAGVINILPSSSTAVGEMMVTDPRVDMISFTGSTATGRKIMAAGAETVKKVFLELGGKSANIVLDDADFATASVMAPLMSCVHAGQGCAFYTRLLLPRSRYEEGLEMVKMGFANISVGDPTNPGMLAGPVINKRQHDRVLDYIEKGKADGGHVLVGGGRPADLDKGYYVAPTLISDVSPESSVAQEEIFGPVLVALPYEDEDDAVRIANNSIYGLSGSVWSSSEDHALSVARRIRTGTLSVNGAQWQDISRPFGGYKQSGNGREWGVEGFEEYLETKVVALPG
ncbi:MAG: aldehyde dehydrogenase family protein [Actinomycetota bacterium]